MRRRHELVWYVKSCTAAVELLPIVVWGRQPVTWDCVLTRRRTCFVNATALLACVAGGFLVYQGLAAAGVMKRRARGGETVCAAAPLFRNFLTSRRRTDVFMAGLFTGFLPCGLLYGMLALAAGTGSVGHGLIVMGVFGLGTLPLMTLTGLSGSLLRVTTRQRLLKLAAWSVVIAGVMTFARGIHQLGADSVTSAAAACPMCQHE